jgi:peroxiredoxin
VIADLLITLNPPQCYQNGNIVHARAETARAINNSATVSLMRTLATLLLAAVVTTSAIHAQALSGRRAPSFSLPDSSLKQHDILDYRGRWLFIDFMLTNCPHCATLSRQLEIFKGKHAGQMTVLSIVLPPDNLQTVAKYISDNKVTSPILFDCSNVGQSYFNATPQHPSFDTPHLFAIDPKGTIVKDWSQAAIEGKSFMDELEQVIGGTPAKATKK